MLKRVKNGVFADAYGQCRRRDDRPRLAGQRRSHNTGKQYQYDRTHRVYRGSGSVRICNGKRLLEGRSTRHKIASCRPFQRAPAPAPPPRGSRRHRSLQSDAHLIAHQPRRRARDAARRILGKTIMKVRIVGDARRHTRHASVHCRSISRCDSQERISIDSLAGHAASKPYVAGHCAIARKPKIEGTTPLLTCPSCPTSNRKQCHSLNAKRQRAATTE